MMFFVKKNRPLKNGECPLLVRITVNGISQETLIGRSILPAAWDQKMGRAVGKDRLSFEVNAYIDTVRSRVIQIHRQMELDGRHITAREIRDLLRGNGARPRMLLDEFRKHNDKCRTLIGTEYSPVTVSRFDRVVRYLIEYTQAFYRRDDTPLREVDHEFVSNFEHFLKTEKGLGVNAVVKQLKCLKKITRMALLNDWISKDPFINVRLREKCVEREFLETEEIERLMQKELPIERLAQVRDVFVFCCFCGLAFTDVKGLRAEHIVHGRDGEVWIRKARQKTKNMCDIPLLQIPLGILERYREQPECLKKGVLLPVLSNQKMNGYLKALADLCGIPKNLSTHVARHTFATVALTHGMSIDSVAKMLGHSNTDMTRHYARVLDTKVSSEMNQLRAVFDKKVS